MKGENEMPYDKLSEVITNQSKTERRQEMYFMLERMTELERLVENGKRAEKSLIELEKAFKKLCEMEVE